MGVINQKMIRYRLSNYGIHIVTISCKYLHSFKLSESNNTKSSTLVCLVIPFLNLV
jgi:hypothetical protein